MRGEQFIDLIVQHVRDQDEYFLARKMIVADTADGLVTLQEPVTGETYGEPFAATLGVAYEAGQEVMVLPVGGRALYVLPPVQREVPASLSFVAPLVAPGYNSPLLFSGAQSTADVSSTTSTVNYSVAMTLSCALAAGTWTVRAMGGVQLIHSAGGNLNWQCNVDGIAGTERTLQGSSTTYSSYMTGNAQTGRSGTIDVTMRFKSSAAGTTQARNPWLLVVAVRTA